MMMTGMPLVTATAALVRAVIPPATKMHTTGVGSSAIFAPDTTQVGQRYLILYTLSKTEVLSQRHKVAKCDPLPQNQS